MIGDSRGAKRGGKCLCRFFNLTFYLFFPGRQPQIYFCACFYFPLGGGENVDPGWGWGETGGYLKVVRRGDKLLHLLAGEDVGGGEVALGVTVLASLGRGDVDHLQTRAACVAAVSQRKKKNLFMVAATARELGGGEKIEEKNTGKGIKRAKLETLPPASVHRGKARERLDEHETHGTTDQRKLPFEPPNVVVSATPHRKPLVWRVYRCPGENEKRTLSHLGGAALDDHEATLADGTGLHGVDERRAGISDLEGLDIIIRHLEKNKK